MQLGAGDTTQEYLGEVGVGQGLEVVDEQLGGRDADDVGPTASSRTRRRASGTARTSVNRLAEVVDDDTLGAQDRG